MDTPLSRAAFDVAENCACMHSRRLARMLTRVYDAALVPAGITGPQFNLLVALQLGGAIPVTKLAAVLDIERTTVTRNLRHLEQKGLVTLITGGDARVRLVSITGTGRRTLKKALPLWRAVQKEVGGKKITREIAALQPNY